MDNGSGRINTIIILCRISPVVKGMRIQTEAKTSNKNSTIPAVSYSSSDEDEDDFFDAQEDAASKAGSDVSSMMAAPVSNSTHHVTPLTPSDIDWDDLYDDDAQEEDVDMKSHGSVITHLISQVRCKNCIFQCHISFFV